MYSARCDCNLTKSSFSLLVAMKSNITALIAIPYRHSGVSGVHFRYQGSCFAFFAWWRFLCPVVVTALCKEKVNIVIVVIFLFFFFFAYRFDTSMIFSPHFLKVVVDVKAS